MTGTTARPWYLAAACAALAATAGAAATGASPASILVGAQWVCTDLLDGASLAPVPDGDPELTLQLDDAGGFSGNNGCNDFVGAYANLTKTAVDLGAEVMGTHRACVGTDPGAEERRRRERAFIDVLRGPVTYKILRRRRRQRRLELSTEGAGVVARFKERRRPLLLDVDWVATEVVRSREEGGANFGYPLGPPLGNLTLHLDSATSEIGGSTGCNRFFGTFSAPSEEWFTIDHLGLTRAGCRSAELRKQQDAYFSLLQGLIQYRWREATLELLGGETGWTVIGRYVKENKREGEVVGSSSLAQ